MPQLVQLTDHDPSATLQYPMPLIHREINIMLVIVVAVRLELVKKYVIRITKAISSNYTNISIVAVAKLFGFGRLHRPRHT